MRMRSGRTTQSRMELSRRIFWDWDPEGMEKFGCIVLILILILIGVDFCFGGLEE